MYSSDFRAKARQILAGKWGMAIVVTLIAGILGGLVGSSGFRLEIDLDEEWMPRIPEVVLGYLTIAGSIGGLLATVQFIVGGVVKLGYCQYLLKLHDGEEAELKDLFSQFSDRFVDGFLLSLLTSIYIFLWSLLFIIPGIVATFKYAMAPFILLENPDMKPGEAITASKEMMDGHKARLFCLDFSFIGWAFLSVLTMGIGGLWLSPYMNASYAAFYRNLSPRPTIIDAEPVIPESGPEVL